MRSSSKEMWPSGAGEAKHIEVDPESPREDGTRPGTKLMGHTKLPIGPKWTGLWC